MEEKKALVDADPPPYSATLSNASELRTTFACLSLHKTDRIQFFQFPRSDITAIHQALRSWPQGIQDQQDYYGPDGVHEIKLWGNPWSGRQADAVHARRLMCRVFQALHERGWLLSFATNISKRNSDKQSLLFRPQQLPPPPPCDWCCISFSRSDRLRFIDAPDDLVRSIIRRLGQDVQSHERHDEPGVYELKICGYPWSAGGSDTVVARAVALRLLAGLEAHGFSVYASIEQKAHPSDGHLTETDTWHCCRLKNRAEEGPVFEP